MSSICLHGIPNCDTVRKARNWLEVNGVPYVFHDFRKEGITRELIASWLTAVTWDGLVNRKGLTWRGLPEQRKISIVDAASACDLMLELPAVIKRPVLAIGSNIHVGFSDALYQQIFAK